ncbi:hypothetical protein D3C87_883230 [compost metagenome]
MVVVVHQIDTEQAAPPGIAREAILGIRIGSQLIEQPVRTTDVLLVAQPDAIVERIARLRVERRFRVRHRGIDLRRAVQTLQWFLIVDHFAECLARYAGFFQRHVVALVHQSEPVDVVVDAVVQNPAGAADGFCRVEIIRLLAVYKQLRTTLGDSFDVVAGIFLQPTGHIGPVDLVWRGSGSLCGKPFCRWVVGLGRRLAADEVGVQRDAEHRGVAALPTCAEVHRISQLENRADVDRRVLLDLIILRLILVIVAFIFEFEAERVPRRLVAHAAKQ